jgi:hypothetical protein
MNPENSAVKEIETMYAYLAVDRNDLTEGIIGMSLGDGTWMPMVGADKERIDSLLPAAQAIAHASGQVVKLVHFSNREVIKENISE